MKTSILVVGGCKSGKSRHALELAQDMAPDNRAYVATCVPRDDEMHLRVKNHKAERDDTWTSLEVPVAVPEAIREQSGLYSVMLVDCLTLWISNLMLEDGDVDAVLSRGDELVSAIGEAHCPVILVSNEVGGGIVPENRLARRFRDAAGMINQKVAAACDQVIWTVAGIPVKIKQGKC